MCYCCLSASALSDASAPQKLYASHVFACKFLNVVIIFRSVHVSFVSIMLHIEYWSLHWANFGRFFGAVSVPKKRPTTKDNSFRFPFQWRSVFSAMYLATLLCTFLLNVYSIRIGQIAISVFTCVTHNLLFCKHTFSQFFKSFDIYIYNAFGVPFYLFSVPF